MPKVKDKRLPDMTKWSDERIHEFWEYHDSADYWDETKPVEIQATRSKQRAVAVKLDEKDITHLKILARKLGIGHTTLIRIWVKEKLRRGQSAKA